MLELLRKIGKGVKSLKLFSMKISNKSFLDTVDRVRNLESLNLNWIDFTGENGASTKEQYLKKLQYLTIGGLYSGGAVLDQVIPGSLSLLEMRIEKPANWIDLHSIFFEANEVARPEVGFSWVASKLRFFLTQYQHRIVVFEFYTV